MMEISVVRRRVSERCAYCHDHAGLTAVRCEGCGTLLHMDCKSQLEGCPTLGCAPHPRVQVRAQARGVLDTTSHWVRTAWAIALPTVGLALALAFLSKSPQVFIAVIAIMLVIAIGVGLVALGSYLILWLMDAVFSLIAQAFTRRDTRRWA